MWVCMCKCMQVHASVYMLVHSLWLKYAPCTSTSAKILTFVFRSKATANVWVSCMYLCMYFIFRFDFDFDDAHNCIRKDVHVHACLHMTDDRFFLDIIFVQEKPSCSHLWYTLWICWVSLSEIKTHSDWLSHSSHKCSSEYRLSSCGAQHACSQRLHACCAP